VTVTVGWRFPSLQARLTAVLALGALLLSLALALIAYGFSRSYLQGQRIASAERQAYLNARLVRDQLRPGNVYVTDLLTGLPGSSGGAAVVEHQGRWYASTLADGRDVLPAALRLRVLAGSPARQILIVGGAPHLAVGIPLPEVDAAYFDISDLSELNRTLHDIALALTLAALATAVAGALIGRLAAQRLTRPLRRVAQASVNLANGDLDTRLPPARDREIVALVDSFNEMAGALQRRIERDARFAADVSHELRSPLTTLAATLSVLNMRRDALPDRGRQALGLLNEEMHRFQRLVQDLLEISRADGGSDRPQFELVRLDELVVRVCQDSSTPNLTVSVDDAARQTVMLLDKRRMERALANLLDNAVRHGGGPTAVHISVEPGAACIAVDDAGAGIGLPDRERVFERFARGPGGRTGTEGAGLGLALVREHVRVHGGAVWVEDSPAGGARFVIRLPVRSV